MNNELERLRALLDEEIANRTMLQKVVRDQYLTITVQRAEISDLEAQPGRAHADPHRSAA